jgi:organic radical activating enzyme
MSKVKRDYSQQTLLNDSSVRWQGFDQEDLMASVRKELAEGKVTRLRHAEVRYEVTDHCNAACIMCPREIHELGRPHGVMDQNKYQKSVDEVAELGCKQIVLTGFGEPLVDKKLEQKVAYAKSLGMRTYIISNASLLTKKRATGLIEAGLDELRVSFYGMTKESYETVMVGLNFDVTMKNLLGFLKLRDEMGTKKPRLELNWLELPENAADTQPFQDYCLLLRLQQYDCARKCLRAAGFGHSQRREIPVASIGPPREEVCFVPVLQPVRPAIRARRSVGLHQQAQSAKGSSGQDVQYGPL